MSNYTHIPEGKDPVLWEIARKRASFKAHATSYILINVFLWAIWYFTSGNFNEGGKGHYPWPIWTTLGWGVGLAFHFVAAYVAPQINSTESEYEKLKKNQ